MSGPQTGSTVTIPITIPHPGALLRRWAWAIGFALGVAAGHYGGAALGYARAHLPALPIIAAADPGPAPDPDATDAPTVGATLRDLVDGGYATALLAGRDAAQPGATPAGVIDAIRSTLAASMRGPAIHVGKVLDAQLGTDNSPLDEARAGRIRSYLGAVVPTLHPARKK